MTVWVAIVGSRSFGTCSCTPPEDWPPKEQPHPEDCAMMAGWLLMLRSITRFAKRPGFEGIVSGGAAGADTMAEQAAEVLGVRAKIYHIQGGRSPFAVRARERNARVVKAADALLAFYDPALPKTPGTSHTVSLAHRKGLEVHIWYGKWEG